MVYKRLVSAYDGEDRAGSVREKQERNLQSKEDGYSGGKLTEFTNEYLHP